MTEAEWANYEKDHVFYMYVPSLQACAYCEHFDGGGEKLVKISREKAAKVLHGDCLCNTSPRFETKSDQTCASFFRNTTF